ncbi:MAG: hypothetical protein RJB03_806 [Bacteroidota bacterium]|jgi:hypothetical protein
MQPTHTTSTLTQETVLKDTIIENLHNPAMLETLYRAGRSAFQQAFDSIYPQVQHELSAQIWNQRLHYTEKITVSDRREWAMVFVTAIISGVITNLPKILGIEIDVFLQSNISFVVFPMLMVFFGWKNKLNFKQLAFPLVAVIISVFYINLIPHGEERDSFILAAIHLPLFLWAVLGFIFGGANLTNLSGRIAYLRFNGDFVVMTAIIMLSGFLFTGITIGLFEIIGMQIGEFYANYILTWALPAVPIVATYLIQKNPTLVNRISPIIAKIFTPIVLVTLIIFLTAMSFSGKNIYDDRNMLVVFNALLVGVMALILFSITEATKGHFQKIQLFFLMVLSILTVVANGIALSAILFRLFEFGITPNRIAVLGANALIFTHLIWVAKTLIQIWNGKQEIESVEITISKFLPIYAIWTAVVVFVLPFLFGFK